MPLSCLIDDPRLPNPEERVARIYGHKRPTIAPPWRSRILIEKPYRHGKYRVEANRTRKRFWLVCVVDGFMSDYASTTSQRIADGWIAAITEAKE